jgi:hypothetical protein
MVSYVTFFYRRLRCAPADENRRRGLLGFYSSHFKEGRKRNRGSAVLHIYKGATADKVFVFARLSHCRFARSECFLSLLFFFPSYSQFSPCQVFLVQNSTFGVLASDGVAAQPPKINGGLADNWGNAPRAQEGDERDMPYIVKYVRPRKRCVQDSATTQAFNHIIGSAQCTYVYPDIGQRCDIRIDLNKHPSARRAYLQSNGRKVLCEKHFTIFRRNGRRRFF